MRGWKIYSLVFIAVTGLVACEGSGDTKGTPQASSDTARARTGEELPESFAITALAGHHRELCNSDSAFHTGTPGTFHIASGGREDAVSVRSWIDREVRNVPGYNCIPLSSSHYEEYECVVGKDDDIVRMKLQFNIPGRSGNGVDLIGCLFHPTPVILDRTPDAANPKIVTVTYALSQGTDAFQRFSGNLTHGYSLVNEVDSGRQYSAVFRRLDATGWQLDRSI